MFQLQKASPPDSLKSKATAPGARYTSFDGHNNWIRSTFDLHTHKKIATCARGLATPRFLPALDS